MFNKINDLTTGLIIRTQNAARKDEGQGVLEYVMIAIALSIVAFFVYKLVGIQLREWVTESIINQVFKS